METKVVNRTLIGNLLRCVTKEYGQIWDVIISQEEYTYNKSKNRTTGKSPFEIDFVLEVKVEIVFQLCS